MIRTWVPGCAVITRPAARGSSEAAAVEKPHIRSEPGVRSPARNSSVCICSHRAASSSVCSSSSRPADVSCTVRPLRTSRVTPTSSASDFSCAEIADGV